MEDDPEMANAMDASYQDEKLTPNRLCSRAYQLEMFEQSMRANTIVAVCGQVLLGAVSYLVQMDTGSGKTQIAKLRIEAELERSSQKRVWFCAPSVVLAQQQHIFLSSQLPSSQIRLITGLDNVQFWSSQDVWDATLHNIDVVVSTPQVLLDALAHGFVTMQQLSLLVFDEAHHCIRNEPMAMIMNHFFHPVKKINGSLNLPHILGLTASPITNKPSMLSQLEANMNAVCKTPTLQLQDYKQHVYLPILERIPFRFSAITYSSTVRALETIVTTLPLNEDPTVKWLQKTQEGNPVAKQKLAKIVASGKTPVLKQMSSFLGHTQHICDNVGQWAADLYVNACARRLREAVILREVLVPDLAEQEQSYADQKLQSVLQSVTSLESQIPTGGLVASKAQAVIEYLVEAYRPGITVIVFVKRRSVAFALTTLFQTCPLMKEYQTFSFVGATNPARRTLVDLVDMQSQNEAFADFQAGRRNICVATQVMEEGVDVQATNLVIRFDEPETFRSFIQSRGRARRADSKFVMVHSTDDNNSTKKIKNWHELEHVMKEQYSELNRSLLDQEAAEARLEEGNELYRVSPTGALLTYDNAQQHVSHFCATLPRDENGEPAQAVTIITGEPSGPKLARLILPSSVPSSLQVHNSLRTWRTEKMARKDVAFQTYRKLHMAKLVNDNLLPWPIVRKAVDKAEVHDSTYEVQDAINVWKFLQNSFPETSYIHGHRVQVSGQNFALPDMVVLLPIRLDGELSFSLRSTTSDSMSVTIVADPSLSHTRSDVASRITNYLFQIILGRRLKRVNDMTRLPYFITPDVPSSELPTWLTQAMVSTPLSQLVFNDALGHQTYLLKKSGQEILYRWRPSFNDRGIKKYLPEDSITAERLSKQLSYFANSLTKEDGEPITATVRSLVVEDCYVQKLSPAYGDFMLLMPSISYMLATALRGQIAATQTSLSLVGFSNSNLISQALTSSSASSEYNYEALEFVGDSLLKYYASVHVFFEYPEFTEGGLNAKYKSIASNARLQRATKELGLDAYITVENFSGNKWTLAMADEASSKRQMSSKTLADVIEALIGAAYLDANNGPTKDELPMSALSQLFPKVTWKSPITHVQEYQRSAHLSKANIARLEDVETILGYQFKYKAVLLEALTRTGLRAGAQSFQRLEFLGDAILDRIVNVALYHSPFGHDPEHLKYRRDALVNRWLLAYLAMQAHHIAITNTVATTASGQTSIVPTTRTVRLIDHMRTSKDRPEQLQRHAAEQTFLAAHPTVASALISGQTFPWTILHSIDTSKSYSDVIESLLAAVYIDSGASLPTCERILHNLGLQPILHRLVTDPNIDVRQPIIRLLLAYPDVQTKEKTSTIDNNDAGDVASPRRRRWTVTVSLPRRNGDGSENEVVAVAHSEVSLKHAEAKAAEEAWTVLSARDNDNDNDAVVEDDRERMCLD